MQIASIISNDVQNSDSGVTTSLWVSGCSHHCFNCHNKDLWDYNKGKTIDPQDVVDLLVKSMTSEGVEKNLSILGGEPLDPRNYKDVLFVVKSIKRRLPNRKIYLWTGYTYKEVRKLEILSYIDVLIDGRYEEDKRDLTLVLRGSSNQHIYRRKGKKLVLEI